MTTSSHRPPRHHRPRAPSTPSRDMPSTGIKNISRRSASPSATSSRAFSLHPLIVRRTHIPVRSRARRAPILPRRPCCRHHRPRPRRRRLSFGKTISPMTVSASLPSATSKTLATTINKVLHPLHTTSRTLNSRRACMSQRKSKYHGRRPAYPFTISPKTSRVRDVLRLSRPHPSLAPRRRRSSSRL